MERLTKEDWWEVCYALREQADTYQRNAEKNYGNAIGESQQAAADKLRDILTLWVNNKLSERDKYGSFSEFVDY